MGIPSEIQTVLTNAQKGDREAFRVLYGMLSPRVFRFIRPRARNREDALDVLQETFIDFWKGLPSFIYQGDSALDAFLYRIATRKLSRVFSLWKEHASLEDIEDVVVDETLSKHGTAIEVALILASLSSKDKAIIVSRSIEGKSFAEISQLFGQSENVLKVRHHRALNRLRKKIGYE